MNDLQECVAGLRGAGCRRSDRVETGPKLPIPLCCWTSPTMPTISRATALTRMRAPAAPCRRIIFPRERFAHHRHWRALRRIGVAEVPARTHRDAHRFEIARRDIDALDRMGSRSSPSSGRTPKLSGRSYGNVSATAADCTPGMRANARQSLRVETVHGDAVR